MKAISIIQPYADLILHQKKTIEVRSFQTRHRGAILICSSISRQYIDNDSYMFGYARCIVNIDDVQPFDENHTLAACCDYEPGLMAWLLSNVRPVVPFKVRGMPGIYNVDDHLIRLL